MLYLIPALAVVVTGGIVGGLASPFARPRPAAAFGRRVAWVVALTVGGAVLAAWALPERPALNAPIGATCEDMDSLGAVRRARRAGRRVVRRGSRRRRSRDHRRRQACRHRSHVRAARVRGRRPLRRPGS